MKKSIFTFILLLPLLLIIAGIANSQTQSSFNTSGGSGGGSATPGGASGAVQFNNAGALGGNGNLKYDSAGHVLSVGAASTPTGTDTLLQLGPQYLIDARTNIGSVTGLMYDAVHEDVIDGGSCVGLFAACQGFYFEVMTAYNSHATPVAKEVGEWYCDGSYTNSSVATLPDCGIADAVTGKQLWVVDTTGTRDYTGNVEGKMYLHDLGVDGLLTITSPNLPANNNALTINATDSQIVDGSATSGIAVNLTRTPGAGTGYHAPIAVNVNVGDSGSGDVSNTQLYGSQSVLNHANTNASGLRSGYAYEAGIQTASGASNVPGTGDPGTDDNNNSGLYGYDVYESIHGGTVNELWMFSASVPDIQAPGAVTNSYAFYAGDQTGATNPYYSWFDSRGVRRVKEDKTFDGVGQAIEALYNPQFTKYAPGATNYERVVMGQWNGNVAEIGTQAGGTGVLRPARIIGASVDIPEPISYNGNSPPTNSVVCYKAGGVLGWASNTAGVIGTTCN